MKLACCISGQPRCFKSAYKSLKENILDHFDCDIFISTWSKEETLELGRNASWRYEDEGSLDEFRDL